jgi:hypothetical protein
MFYVLDIPLIIGRLFLFRRANGPVLSRIFCICILYILFYLTIVAVSWRNLKKLTYNEHRVFHMWDTTASSLGTVIKILILANNLIS